MIIHVGRSFTKDYKRLTSKVQEQFKKRVILFEKDPSNPTLHVHPLKGDFAGYWSMNVTGDYRAVYEYLPDDVVLFIRIGTHSELYG